MYNCKFCHKSLVNKGAIGSHEPYCKLNPDRKDRYRSPNAGPKKGSIGWNKGKSTPLDVCKKISKGLIGKSKGIALDPLTEIERRKKISISMKSNPNGGGLRKRSGRGKKGRYKGYWCDSSWELAWVIFNLDHDIKFDRNWDSFEYIYNGEIHKYYPDFIKNNVYIEIKGRRNYNSLDSKNKAKLDQFNGNLDVLYSLQMKPILEYVIDNYGKDFINLYD